ncbi:sensor histidine kinase [Ornithinibacillus contaminans]|uniref:sensor histidine kinase n=1 Tax=Ornithinibacillus contaminans TaxID=694055 RepID=UPI00064DD3D2|nr:HAMP domain-containing sensor histidine kinase [Ornithinibacillus contaminans]
MRKRIVLKLFLLTSGLCLFILAAIYIGQTIFFERFYAEKKVNQLTEAVDLFKEDYQNHDDDEAVQLEQEFYRENNAWITVLDENGNPKGMDDYYLELDGAFFISDTHGELTRYTDKSIKIPIYYIINPDDLIDIDNYLADYQAVEVHSIEKDSALYPYRIFWDAKQAEDPIAVPFELQQLNAYSFWENEQLFVKRDKAGRDANSIIYGRIKDIHLPDETMNYYATLSNQLFIERLKQFQADLILDEKRINETELLDFEQDGITYKLLVSPETDSNGDTIYYFTMASLQPVNEAVQMVEEYYIYIILFSVILIFLAAFYYSKGIAKPLLTINDTAKRMANLDFTERITVKSKDEIGELSNNINFLSDTVQSHINQLQQDVEKERKLEKTRKDFIAGVSHELKTPLSIMKGCLAILHDGVAVQKREHYFEAMENEVNRMDRLIADMLELAKYESGTYKLEMLPFYIDDLIQTVYNQLVLKASGKQVQVKINLDGAEVVANMHRIEQVITNFLTNAIRHTPNEGVIVLSTVNEVDQVKITVENEGSHIPEDQLDKIWDRFYQGDKTQRSEEGTGLGLAIAKNILTLHGVEYGVFNTAKGVCFYFYLNKNN